MPEITVNPDSTPSGGESNTETAAPVTDAEKETDYAALAEKLSGQMAGGDFSEVCSLFNDTMAAALDEKALKDGWDQVVAKIGAYVGYYDTLVSEKDGSTVVKSILEYESSGVSVMYTFNAEGKIEGLWTNYYTIPAEAEATDSYTETAIKVGEYALDGMLTLPKGVEKPPVIILVHGSGQSDMNETVGANQNTPFKDIAHGLAERGIATIRYNKRYYQFPEKAFADLRVEDEVIADVYAAVDYAGSCGEVDGTKIIVLGHSLGGMLAPVIARDNPEVKGLISFAGSPRYLEDIVYDQNAEVVNASSLSEEDKAKTLEQVKAEADKVKRLTADNIKSGSVILGMSEAYWLSLTQSNGGVIAPGLDIPMLFMQGGADFQVYPDADFKAWQDILAGRDNCTFKLYEGLNHLFMATNGKRDISEYDPKGTVDAAVLDDIAAWVKENF